MHGLSCAEEPDDGSIDMDVDAYDVDADVDSGVDSGVSDGGTLGVPGVDVDDPSKN